MDHVQLYAIFSATALFLVNAILALLLARLYMLNRKSISYLIWSSGLRFFAIAIILEIMFAFGVYSDFLAKLYLFAVSMPLLAFSIGHMQFIRANSIKRYYYYYSIAISLLLLYTLVSSGTLGIYRDYVVYGSLPIQITLASVLLALSSCFVIFIVAISYSARKKDRKMLAIIPGVVAFLFINVIHLQILQMFTYYLQILGIIFIWLGIVGFSGVKEYGPGI